MSNLKDKLMKAYSKNAKDQLLYSDSKSFDDNELVPTPVPMLNLALSGDLAGGFGPGMTFIAGKSKHFKTLYGLLMMRSYLRKYPDSYAVFYDTEYGTPPKYMAKLGIPTDRVIHIPIEASEDFKSDCAKKLDSLEKGDRVFFFVDSVGNMASRKEREDALKDDAKPDMQRAKEFKSTGRVLAISLRKKNLPMVLINHTYETLEMFSKETMSGGTGWIYNADNILFIGRRQIKEAGEKDVAGYEFIIKVHKSRYAKEGSGVGKWGGFPVEVTHAKGINRFSGLLDLALDTGHAESPTQGWYSRPCVEDDTKVRKADTHSKEWWEPIFKETDFYDVVKRKYTLNSDISLIDDEDD